MKSEKARALRNELVLDALLLTDALAAAAETLPRAEYEELIRQGKALSEDFDTMAKGKSNVSLAYALTAMLVAFGQCFEKYKRETPRVVVPEAADLAFGRKPS